MDRSALCADTLPRRKFKRRLSPRPPGSSCSRRAWCPAGPCLPICSGNQPSIRFVKTVVVIGALIPESLPPSNTDIHAAIDLLRTAHEAQPIPRQAEPYSYRNVAIIRGTQSDIFLQRVPVPLSVWKPFSHGGAPLHLGGPAVLELGGERAALLICYEEVIPWTVLTAALAHPTLFVGISNDHWATGTPIPKWQALCLRAWSRLFWVSYLLAVNT